MPLFRSFGLLELLVVFAIIVLVFGVGRISKVASEIGKGIREFRKGISGDSEQTDQENKDD